MNRKARLRSPTHRKISMVTQATTRALANHLPRRAFPVWYWNVSRSRRNFEKQIPNYFSLRNHGTFIEDFHPVIIKITLLVKRKRTIHASISPMKRECSLFKLAIEMKLKCWRRVILGFWQGKSYSVIFTGNTAWKVQSQQGVRWRERKPKYFLKMHALSSESRKWLQCFTWTFMHGYSHKIHCF